MLGELIRVSFILTGVAVKQTSKYVGAKNAREAAQKKEALLEAYLRDRRAEIQIWVAENQLPEAAGIAEVMLGEADTTDTEVLARRNHKVTRKTADHCYRMIQESYEYGFISPEDAIIRTDKLNDAKTLGDLAQAAKDLPFFTLDPIFVGTGCGLGDIPSDLS